MSNKGCFVILLILFNVLDCLRDADVNTFGVLNAFYDGYYHPYSGVCGINYETNTIYTIDGSTSEPDYSTWNGLNTINEDNCLNITTPMFVTTVINKRRQFWCITINCGTQIGRDPYIYIVGAFVQSGFVGTMMIFDMNSNDYVAQGIYKKSAPDSDGFGC